eukprot:TRINITY_DN8708_c0_g1_i8.p1 TRINITY_DN8708_c0_g1~~TRINITY_DN8708_c0_g1_i8.p1  ORF type:complete len:177 (+),score=21.27 TRINITY_DN8708_c0_g1_i8:78-608(+)
MCIRDRYVRTRNSNQIRSHLQKYFLKKRKAKIKRLQKEGILGSRVFIITKEYRNQKIAAKRKSKPKRFQLAEFAIDSYESHNTIQEPPVNIIDINDQFIFRLEGDYEREHLEYSNFLEDIVPERSIRPESEFNKGADDIAFESLDFSGMRGEIHRDEDKDEFAWVLTKELLMTSYL